LSTFTDILPPNWSLALEKSIPWSLTSDTEDDEESGHLIQLDIVHPTSGSEEDQTTTMSGRTRVEFLISRSGVLRLPDPPDRTPAQELHWQMLPHTTIPVSHNIIRGLARHKPKPDTIVQISIAIYYTLNY
jgi:hypothetical protein